MAAASSQEIRPPQSEIQNSKLSPEAMKARTKQFALRIIRVVQALPERNRTADVIGRQLLRAGTSVGANYRAACRAKSRADFISKMGTVEEEADEVLYWMELLIESNLVKKEKLESLMAEGHEIVAIIVSSINTARHGPRKN
ncbi:four helix bundle protein [candidate division KSB1 bacterium]|nr:MAG: four helix bundle protein [candidate division KSB1 bacterium]MBC6950923.1 four helix bundle protein [candidate division KSB1 bacterium]MCE7945541.1 four helix bundle protein [Chlorobi bacterium CHB1]MDL1878269.1 four helix bundle protein [Cytophagia bacterium CHB2]